MDFKCAFFQSDMLNGALKIHMKLCTKFIPQTKSFKQNFQCEYCKYGMPNQYLLNSHKKICPKNKDNYQNIYAIYVTWNSIHLSSYFNTIESVSSFFA